MSTITLRRLRPDDSMDELTAMLRRAFTRLGASGMNCTCVTQTPAITLQRIGLGDCLVALAGTRMVGTVTLQTADPQAEIGWYRHPSVASLHQLAVEPSHQGAGIGQQLLRAAEVWAFNQRCVALALDTPEPARHLLAFYASQGFKRQSTVQIPGRSYRSAVLSKSVRHNPTVPQEQAWPPRHPAEMALMAQQVRLHGYEATGNAHRSEVASAAALGVRHGRGWSR